jgi:hypothetical protein
MKLKTKIIMGSALAFLTVASGGLFGQVMNTVTLTTAIQLQNNSTNNGTITTTPAPIKYAFDTKQILAALAGAEFIEGKYALPFFPSGAKLVMVFTAGQTSNFDFQVVSSSNVVLVDVSDLLTGLATGVYGGDITSGKKLNATGVADPSLTDAEIFTVTYDDTGVPGSLGVKLALSGLLTNTVTDTVPNKTTGVYTETQTHTLTGAAGDGSYQSDPGVGTCTFSASGKGTLTAQ